jgi:hypothetical protein
MGHGSTILDVPSVLSCFLFLMLKLMLTFQTYAFFILPFRTFTASLLSAKPIMAYAEVDDKDNN